MSLAAYKILANKSPFQSVAAHGGSKSAIRDESTVPGEEGLCGDKNVGWILDENPSRQRWRVDGGTE